MALSSFTRRTLGACTLALAACSSGTGPDTHADLDAARIRWVTGRPSDYTFEYATATAALPGRDGWYRVEVRGGSVASARHLDTGTSVPANVALTVDRIWDRILAARARGEPVTSLRFDGNGVPLSAMVGTFANDGGVHYSVRRFTVGR